MTTGRLYFRIGEVAELLGVEAHVLRYWEGEFRFRPHRSGSGQRLYRQQDIDRFSRIKALLHDEGFTIAGARRALLEAEAPVAAGPVSGVGPVVAEVASAPLAAAPVESAVIERIAGQLQGVLREIQALRAEIARARAGRPV